MQIELLSDDVKIVTICNDYWALSEERNFRKKISVIARENNITIPKVSQIAKANSIAHSSNKLCSICTIPYVYESRNDYLAIQFRPWTCQQCIANKEKKESAEKTNILLNRFLQSQSGYPLTIERLDTKSSILLLALIRFNGNEDFSAINEYHCNQIDKFSPDEQFDRDILSELYEKGIISIHPLSHPSHIKLKENGSFSFDHLRVKWVLPLPAETYIQEFVKQLEEKIISTDLQSYAVIALCKEIALQECLAFLKSEMAVFRFYSFSPGDKTKLILEKALECYSVAQVYSFIWPSVRSAASYAQTGVQQTRAANSVTGHIERAFERNLAEGTDIKVYNRNLKMRQSVLSQVIYCTMMQTNDRGFRIPINELINNYSE